MTFLISRYEPWWHHLLQPRADGCAAGKTQTCLLSLALTVLVMVLAPSPCFGPHAVIVPQEKTRFSRLRRSDPERSEWICQVDCRTYWCQADLASEVLAKENLLACLARRLRAFAFFLCFASVAAACSCALFLEGQVTCCSCQVPEASCRCWRPR